MNDVISKLIDIDENYQQAKFEAKKILIKQKLDKASREQIDKIYSILESVINHDPTQIESEQRIPKFFDYIDFQTCPNNQTVNKHGLPMVDPDYNGYF